MGVEQVSICRYNWPANSATDLVACVEGSQAVSAPCGRRCLLCVYWLVLQNIKGDPDAINAGLDGFICTTHRVLGQFGKTLLQHIKVNRVKSCQVQSSISQPCSTLGLF